MYHLRDTFNGCLLSRHRTVEAAIRAQRRHLSAVRRANGPNSFLTYDITLDGRPIGEEAYWQAMDSIHREDCL
jgi:hypothetical protein